jgi:hypothetical protein
MLKKTLQGYVKHAVPTIEERLDAQIKSLYETLKLYESLSDKDKIYYYRYQAIEMQRDALIDLREGINTNADWMVCYEEDLAEYNKKQKV